jgi:hypothetical protein
MNTRMAIVASPVGVLGSSVGGGNPLRDGEQRLQGANLSLQSESGL